MCVCSNENIRSVCLHHFVINGSALGGRLNLHPTLCLVLVGGPRKGERERKQERYIVVSRDFHTVVPVHISSEDKGTGKEEEEDDDDEERNMIARR